MLKVIDDAEQTPDVLEKHKIETQENGAYANTVTLAAYLYSIARICRNTVRGTAQDLYEAGWMREDAELFMLTFENLVDVWTTYKNALEDLQDASSDKESSSARTVLGTERRRYIEALEKYYIQLLVVLRYIDDAVESSGA